MSRSSTKHSGCKVPGILDEVHWLIEERSMGFVLCGSSARKLKRTHANMLGGRAWRFELHPLTFAEIPNFDLLRALNHGLVPSHYLEEERYLSRTLGAYITDYMREEIMEEGLVRNVPAFSRFLDVLGFCSGELVRYSNIARESGVDAKTVREYFRILADTHLGSLVEPYTGTRKRSVLARTPRFYLFDVGIAGHLARRAVREERGPEFGRALEHLMFMELTAYRSYAEKSFEINYWRTSTGLEVDFVLAKGEVAIEVKGKRLLTNKDTRGLRTFLAETPGPCTGIVVSGESAPRRVGEITILPWAVFLDRLWNGEVI
ncbi:MAG: DUF4143 domain-containing protein [Chitinivibrionales bacterium]|nr:DUF4143 domain-containing protein [Chitinivibrionales bacterium]